MTYFRNAAAALVTFALLRVCSTAEAQAVSQSPSFSGIWVEAHPHSGPPMRIKLSQTGPQVQVWLSYRDSFGERAFGVGAVENDAATWTGPQSCAPRFRSAGYDYDQPSVITFTLSWGQPADDAPLGSVLVYTQETQWNAPCGGHQVGLERIQKVLTRN